MLFNIVVYLLLCFMCEKENELKS